ncbi:hypothetical protein M436DRAFT_85642 [Aureobasidium namibiae CBS 147.97]|uniref:Uncharacterized protein n=1 Tax=Aureobasidium namibiae CBS 147.97 TaxID=1043004 RepID=A0A074W8B1_9PEZI
MHNTLSAEQMWMNRDKRCPLCIQDPTISQADKEKHWVKKHQLTRHMQGEQHSRYFQLRRLFPNIEKSTASSHGDEHDKLKRTAGWYETDFYGEHSDEYKGEVRRNIQTRHSNLGLDVEDPPELPHAVPHPTRVGVMLGPNPVPVPDWINSEESVKYGPMPSHVDAEQQLEATKASVKTWTDQGLISFGPMPDASWPLPVIPNHLKRSVVITDGPGPLSTKNPLKRAKKDYAPKE